MDPQPRRIEPKFALLGAGVVAMILYGSLFPFHFHRNTRPIETIWAIAQFRAERMDIVANFLLYWPLGVCLVLAFRGWPMRQRVAWAILGGSALSATMESIQIFQPARLVSLWEFYGNTAGAALGALTGAVAGGSSRARFLVAARRRPFACLMLASWLGYILFPVLFPPFAAAGPASPLDWFERCTVSLAVALLLEALIRREGPPAFPRAAGLVAVLFALHVSINALRPFQFLPEARPFGWVPFLSFLTASRESAVRAFFEKAFMYGTLVWLMARAGWTVARATMVAAGTVLALRLSQTYLPGRSAEITDTIMVLGLAGVLHLVEKV